MQNNFPQVPIPIPMTNISPLHPMEDPAEQEMMTEVLNIAKIKEGFYIGDKISAISIDVIIQFKITHMINATGNQIMNQWESIGISYLTLNWSETPSQILFDSKDEIANRIVEFVDGALLGKGEGILAHSFKGQNRVCIVVLIYLMKKYKWGLNKSMQYLKSKKQDIDIPLYFLEQLKQFEMRLKSRNELNNTDIPWEYEGLKDPEEKLLRNTYLNGVKIELKNNNNLNINKVNNRHIMWADNNPYQKSLLELNNNENDLFFQTNIKPITVHQSLRPRKGCIKNNNNNVNNNIEISMDNNFTNLIKKQINLSNNFIGEQNLQNIRNNERNNLKIINNNFYQNNNINIINNGKINNMNMNMNINMSTNNNPNNIKNLMNKEMMNNFMEGNNNNIQDMRVNNSVNIPKSSYNINSLNSNINNNNYNNMPFRNENINNNNIIKANKNIHNNNNVSPFRSNNNNINKNNRQNFLVGNNNNIKTNNYIKNPNMSNTQQNFYKDKEKQFNNIMNYTPLIKERNIRENNNNSNSTNINSSNKGIFSQQQQQNQISNYNAIRSYNNTNNFNKNIRNNKPLNNFNPNLIKPKAIQHNDSSLLKRNKTGGPVKIKNNNYINNLNNKKPNTPDLNHYNYNTGGFNMDNNNKYNTNNISTNITNNKKDFKNDTMASGWGYPSSKNNFNRKIVPPRPSTAPQKDKNIIHNNNSHLIHNNNKLNNLNRSNQFANNNMNNNNNKIGRFNQRPSSAGGKSNQNQGYGYVNNMNRGGIKNINKNKNSIKKNNINTGINKRLNSPQIYNTGIGFNNNNQNNLRNKFNPAKHRMPSPVIKSNFGKRPLMGNNGQRIHMNKSEKFN